MKKILALWGLIIIGFTGFSQILKPVKWSFSSQNINEKEAFLIATATIEKGWHVYSQDIGEGGPIPTTLTFVKSPDYKLEGKTTETPKAVSAYDNNLFLEKCQV